MYKVIVIEDEKIIRKGFIADLLTITSKFEIVGEASDGETGIELIKSKKPDIVFVDIEMPGISGLTVIEETIEIDYFAIVISGYDKFEYLQRSIRLKVFDYLLKPLSLVELQKVVYNLIERLDSMHSVSSFKKTRYYDKNKSLNIYVEDIKIKQIVEYIKRNYSLNITSTCVSNELNISVPTMNKLIFDYFGNKLSQILLDFRMQKALLLIYQNEKLNYEIGELVGYRDYKYFSIVFKTYFGKSINELKSEILTKE